MSNLTCGCYYMDSLILSFCDLHEHPGPESHKDGKGIIIRDLEAQLREQESDVAKRIEALEGVIGEFLKNTRVCMAIAPDCLGGHQEDPCGCLYCRARKILDGV